MSAIEQCVRAIRRRQMRQRFWKYTSTGMLLGGLAACVLGLARWATDGAISWAWIAAMLAGGPLVGALVAAVRRPSLRDAAVAIDRTCNLKDRVQTALGFLPIAEGHPLHRLQISDAEQHVARVDPQRVAPMRRPGSFPYALLTGAAALVLLVLSTPRTEVVAAPTSSPAVESSAVRAEAGLEELKEFQEESQDPKLEELLRELAEQIEQLKQPGMDPKEALAQLSEMEAALQEMQQQLMDPSMEAELQQVGEALSLSEAMASAGQAMSQGEMDKAAEELAKLEMPKLDPKTERAITEKLNQLKQNNGEGAAQKRQQMKEAIAQVSEGLSQGNRGKFREGMEGLASECKSQGRRKKLSDLLRKQCQALGECKSECEGACKSEADSNKKGGKKAGSGRSDNQPGDKTPSLKTNPQMNITGQDSGQGDIDVETVEGSAQEQEAARQYREKLDKYEALSESVLSAESIPLGHRQTIRRYFESIRPQGDEMDAVLERSSE